MSVRSVARPASALPRFFSVGMVTLLFAVFSFLSVCCWRGDLSVLLLLCAAPSSEELSSLSPNFLAAALAPFPRNSLPKVSSAFPPSSESLSSVFRTSHLKIQHSACLPTAYFSFAHSSNFFHSILKLVAGKCRALPKNYAAAISFESDLPDILIEYSAFAFYLSYPPTTPIEKYR